MPHCGNLVCSLHPYPDYEHADRARMTAAALHNKSMELDPPKIRLRIRRQRNGFTLHVMELSKTE